MPARRLETRASALARAAIDSESRAVLRGPEHVFEVTVPADASLEVGFGVLDKAWRRGLASAVFEVSFESADARKLLSREVVAKPEAGQNHWSEGVVSLASIAGQTGTLRLRARPTAGNGTADELVWNDPLLVAGPPGKALNLVLISIDTLRADHLGCYGGSRATSPAIDAMANDGILFRNAVAASSWTLPSHATMLSGLDPSRHGAVEFGFTTPLAPSVQTLAEQLWSSGYETAAFTDGFFVSTPLGFDQGFDRFRDPTRLETEARENLRRAADWMLARRGRPLFVFVHTYEVHMPYAPPPPYDTLFDTGYEGPLRRGFTHADYEALQKAGNDDDPKIIEHLKALYDGEIRHVDDAIAEFVETLRSSGLAKDTCVVLTSDHGEEFGEHGDLLHNHAKLYEELVHVPLIVWCPSRFAGGREVAELVGHADLTPTLLEVAGVEPIADIDGRSFAEALGGGPMTGGAIVRSEVDGSVAKREGSVIAVREDRYKLVRSTADGVAGLFDLVADPGETRDASERVPDVRAKLEAVTGEIEQRLRAGRPAVTPASPPEAATKERLRALGYVLP
jgi:arylsulfatase A-like enzyme